MFIVSLLYFQNVCDYDSVYVLSFRSHMSMDHYLMGNKFLLKTDNMSLKYLFDQPNLNARKGIWLDFFRKYHFKLKHTKGKENKIFYALSQPANILYEVTLSQTYSDLHQRIRMKNGVGHFYVEILKVEEDWLFQQQKEYKVDKTELLWSKEILYVLEGGEIRSSILTEFHQNPYSGHPRYQKIIYVVKKLVLWPNLKADIAVFIAKYQ